MMRKSRKIECGLDYFKLIASLFVVGMHMEFLKDVGYIGYKAADYIFRFAVPFFFMSSGYLFEKHNFQTCNEVKKYSKNFIKKLVIPFAIWGGYMLQ